MKKILPILTVVCAVIFMFNGKKYDELVSSRLSSDVAICLQGESCGQAVLAATSSSAAGGARSAEQIYTSGCAACHDAGVAGAPMLANQSQWEQRLAKGTDILINNAWSGIGGMPAKGLCGDCTCLLYTSPSPRDVRSSRMPSSA